MTKDHSPIDLHCHSDRSDGVLPPAQVVQAAARGGVTTLSLTDHDTVDGFAEAAEAAAEAGISLVPGVEISVSWNGTSVHIVGLGIDPASRDLANGLTALQEQRAERALAIAAKLSKAGVADAQTWLATQPPHNCTRMHFARLLVHNGYASTPGQAFKRYLSRGKPAYVDAQWATLEQAVGWIKSAGGLAVVAHPGRYSFGATRLRQLLGEFAGLGGDSLEVSYSGCDRGQINQLCTLARRFSLSASLGSDFHDPALAWTRFGQLPPLPDSVTPVWCAEPVARYLNV